MEISIRKPMAQDGAVIWELVRRSGKLDVNSPYCYMMVCRFFGDTCAIAKQEEKIVGFVTGFRPPRQPDTWFVWQIAVDPEARGNGIARRLMEYVLNRPENSDIRFVEATVSPSNALSRALFLGFARDCDSECRTEEGFRKEWFPDGVHEKEELYRIGPITRKGGD